MKSNLLKRVVLTALTFVLTAGMCTGFCGCKKTVKTSVTSDGEEGSEYVIGWENSTGENDNVLNSGTTSAGTTGNTSASGSGGESVQTTPKVDFDIYANIPTDVKQLKVLLWYTPDNVEQAMFDAFTAKFGIKLKFVYTDNANYLTKLTTLVASNDAPDVAGVYDFPSPIIKGLFQKIDAATAANGGAFNLEKDPAYDLEAMKYASWNGSYYGVQLKGNWHADRPMTVFNRTMFNSKGITDPYTLWKSGNWNWDTFKGCADAMTYTQDGVKVYGCSGSDNFFDKMFLCSSGINYMTFNNDAGTITNNLADSRVVSALTYVSQLKNSGSVATMGTDWQIFTQGKCAMWITGCSQVKKAREFETMTDDWSAVPIPCPAGQSVIAPYGGVSFGIPTGAKHGTAGSYLIRWMLDSNNWDIRGSFHSDEIYNVWLEQQNYATCYYNIDPVTNTVSGLANSLIKVTWGSVNDVATGLKSLSGNADSAISNVINEMGGK